MNAVRHSIPLAALLVSAVLAHPSLAADEDPCSTPTGRDETVCLLIQAGDEERDLRPEAFFFESSRVMVASTTFASGASKTGDQDRLAVEVEFTETVFPYQNRASAPDRHFGGTTFRIGFSPMYRVRIWHERSAPVRVPSFMPKILVQWSLVSKRERGRQWGERTDGQAVVSRAIPLTSVMLSAGHHSNGQDGCLYTDASGRLPDPCLPDPAGIRINRLNGSFSTNYVEASINKMHLSLARAGRTGGSDELRLRTGRTEGALSPNERGEEARGFDSRYSRDRPAGDQLWTGDRRAKHAVFYGFTYQYNFPFDTAGGAVEEPVRPIYGMHRFRAQVGFERFSTIRGGSERRLAPRVFRRVSEARFKVRGWIEISNKSANSADCGPGQRPCAPEFGWGGDAIVGLGSKTDGLGVYARFFQGQDYYNLSFPYRKDNRFQFGLAFSPGRSGGPTFPVLAQERLDEERALTDDEWRAYRDEVRCRVRTQGR